MRSAHHAVVGLIALAIAGHKVGALHRANAESVVAFELHGVCGLVTSPRSFLVDNLDDREVVVTKFLVGLIDAVGLVLCGIHVVVRE